MNRIQTFFETLSVFPLNLFSCRVDKIRLLIRLNHDNRFHVKIIDSLLYSKSKCLT